MVYKETSSAEERCTPQTWTRLPRIEEVDVVACLEVEQKSPEEQTSVGLGLLFKRRVEMLHTNKLCFVIFG